MSTSFYRQSMIPVLLARFEAPAYNILSTIHNDRRQPSSTSNPTIFKTKTDTNANRPHNITLQKKIEVWQTSCIVTNFGKNQLKTECSILINPANDTLSGTSQFPYFPRGGPVPKERPTSQFHSAWQPLGYVSNWGGMDIGSNMMYPNQVIDGMVYQLGGKILKEKCQRILKSYHGKLPLGTGVVTSCHDIPDLETFYDFIIHTTPPFYKHDLGRDSDRNEIELLKKCYTSSFHRIDEFYRHGWMDDESYYSSTSLWDTIRRWLNRNSNEKGNGTSSLECKKTLRIGIPLIGAGARGFPSRIALNVAALQSVSWMMDCDMLRDTSPSKNDETRECILAFGIPDLHTADCLVTEIRHQVS